MINAIVIDDEKRSGKLLANLLKDYCPEVMVAGIASNIDDAYILINERLPDVIFLDIEMQKESGFDLLKKFDKINFDIIFTTAFEHYAVKAIKHSAIDYLLKPIDVEELKAAVVKVLQNNQRNMLNKKFEILMQTLEQNKANKFQIALPSAKGINIVSVNEILYLKSERQYTVFYLKSGDTIMTSKNLGEYEELLLKHNFFRVHHSSLINLAEVKKYIRDEGSYAVMSDGKHIDVSKRKKDSFLKLFSRQ